MKNSYIILGNGFSIDLVQKMNKSDEIDLSNLFKKGEYVTYPKTNQKGFLSRKNTPDLWTLGARSYMSSEESLQLITDVITCANVYNLSAEKKQKGTKEITSIFVRAYSELSSYLRYLFIYYNSLVSDDDLQGIINEIELIKYIEGCIKNNRKVYIVTYNYDVFLERLLTIKGIQFDIFGFTDIGANVVIFKPHGSISFSFKIKVQDTSPYYIRSAINEAITQDASNFDISYDLAEDYPIVNAIIPPAGDSARFGFAWIKEIRKGIEEIVKKSTSRDELILFGLSYWYVDRNEIDDILLSLDSLMEAKYINPYPPSSFEAVMSSLFEKYVHFSSDKLLKEEL